MIELKVDLDDSVHMALKLMAVRQRTTMKALALAAIRELVEEPHYEEKEKWDGEVYTTQ